RTSPTAASAIGLAPLLVREELHELLTRGPVGEEHRVLQLRQTPRRFVLKRRWHHEDGHAHRTISQFLGFREHEQDGSPHLRLRRLLHRSGKHVENLRRLLVFRMELVHVITLSVAAYAVRVASPPTTRSS